MLSTLLHFICAIIPLSQQKHLIYFYGFYMMMGFVMIFFVEQKKTKGRVPSACAINLYNTAVSLCVYFFLSAF